MTVGQLNLPNVCFVEIVASPFLQRLFVIVRDRTVILYQLFSTTQSDVVNMYRILQLQQAVHVRRHVISSNINTADFLRNLMAINEWNHVRCHVSNRDYQAGSVLAVVETKAEETVDAVADCWDFVAFEEKFRHH